MLINRELCFISLFDNDEGYFLVEMFFLQFLNNAVFCITFISIWQHFVHHCFFEFANLGKSYLKIELPLLGGSFF